VTRAWGRLGQIARQRPSAQRANGPETNGPRQRQIAEILWVMGFDDERQSSTLTEDECWRLLEAKDLGRLAVSVQDQPDIFPVNYAADRGRLYLRTAQGSKLLELTINSHVALEIDEIGSDSAVSVVVKGTARRLEKEAEILAAEKLPVRPRVGTDKPVFVEITPTDVAGRRFTFVSESQ